MPSNDQKHFNAVHYSAAPTSDGDATEEPTTFLSSTESTDNLALTSTESTDNLALTLKELTDNLAFTSQKETSEKYLPLPPVIISTAAEYAPVPHFKVIRPPDKSRRTCCQKLSLYSCLVGFVFIIASVIW